MAKGFKHGAGGSNVLNFKVVGNPQPTNPKENTIWVNTDTPITGWHLGAEEPGIDYLIFPYSSGEHLFTNGITFTANADKSITVNGIAQGGRADYVCYIGTFKPGKYKLSGLTEINGADGISVWNNDNSTSVAYLTTSGTYEFEVTTEFYGNVTLLIQEGSSHSNTIVRPKLLYCSVGMAWITTGTFSTVAFNALKKNGIQVYPISAKQYIGGAWVDKTAKSWQNGAWVDWWDGELFQNGNQYTEHTGGWISAVSTGISVTIGDAIVFTIIESYGRDASAFTKNKIDVTNYSAIIFEVNVTNNAANFNVGITESNTSYIPNMIAKSTTSANGQQTLTVDISGVRGFYYVAAHANTCDATITKIKLVR